MQYKIPINIENEDPIVFGLSIRQLSIIFAWLGLGYAIFNSLDPYLWKVLAWFPAVIVVVFFVFVALVKISEMTFMVLILNWIRAWANQKERYWQKWVDSFSALDVGYITNIKNKVEKIEVWNKIEKIKSLDEQLEKI